MRSAISNVLQIQANKSLTSELSFGAISLITFEAVMQAVIICFSGYVVAKAGLLKAAGQKAMSSINVELFTPCLVFIKLASSLSVCKLEDILIIPIFYSVSTLTSYYCSRMMSRIMNLNSPETDFVTAMGVFGNSNSLPVSLTLSLAYTLPDLLWEQIVDDDSDKVASRGILYLLIFQQLGQILRWSWGFNTLLRKRSIEELSSDRRITSLSQADTGSTWETESQIGNDTVNDVLRNLTPQDEALNEHSNPEEDSSNEDAIQLAVATSEEFDRKSQNSGFNHMCACIKIFGTGFSSWWPIRSFISFMNPPLYATVFSIFVASIPKLQSMFFEKGTFINNTITQSVKQLGSVSIPLILIVMGSNLAPNKDVPPPSRNYQKIVLASLISRMVLPSVILLPVITLCVKFINVSILDDPIFLIVAFLLTVSPPAIQLSQITQLNKVYQSEMAGVLAWGYVVLTLPTTIFIVVTSLEVLKWAN